MKTATARGLVLILVLTLTTTFVGISALQETTPDWLVRSENSISLVNLAVFTNEGEVAQDEFYDEFAGFTVDSSAYVYVFNVGAPDESGDRDINMLMPNAIDTDNFFEPGEYTISPEFILEEVPTGTAYVQAFATPFPVDVQFSSDQDFTFQGNDPDLFFRGIEFDITSQGVLSTEYSADWTSYAVREGGIESFAAGTRCTKVKISVPEAVDVTVSYTIDANCINGAPLSGTFNGPTSAKIAQVLEGERTVTITVPNFQQSSSTGMATFGRTTTIEVTPEPFPDFFDVIVSNAAPQIFEEVTFTPVIQTSREIEEVRWTFGDGFVEILSAEEFGQQSFATHTYTEGSGEFDYRVTFEIEFNDGGENVLIEMELPIGDTPIPGSCPPDAVVTQTFARSVLFETEVTGCASLTIPTHLIDQSALTHDGVAELVNQFTWESLPENVPDLNVQAIATVNYIDDVGVIQGSDKFSMVKNGTGFFTINPRITVPANTSIELVVSMVVVNNPTFSRIALEAGPFEIKSITNCSGASLVPRNVNSESEGFGISFDVGQVVDIVFTNTGCSDIIISPGTLEITRNGERVYVIPNNGETIGVNGTTAWTWNQRDFNGSPVVTGNYVVTIQTSQGEYTTEFKILD